MDFLKDIPSFPSLFSPQRASSGLAQREVGDGRGDRASDSVDGVDGVDGDDESDCTSSNDSDKSNEATKKTNMESPALKVTPVLSAPAATARARHTYTTPKTVPTSGARTPSLATGTSPASVVRASTQRNKVQLKPGFSALDWARLRSSGKNLRGVDYPGLIRVSAEELARHNKPHDAWTVLGGKVYNLTHYMGFHPGGDRDLIRIAGKDGTKQFMATHSWVSYESMLDGCLVGFYQP